MSPLLVWIVILISSMRRETIENSGGRVQTELLDPAQLDQKLVRFGKSGLVALASVEESVFLSLVADESDGAVGFFHGRFESLRGGKGDGGVFGAVHDESGRGVFRDVVGGTKLFGGNSKVGAFSKALHFVFFHNRPFERRG